MAQTQQTSPHARPIISRILSPFDEFIRTQAFGGLLLLTAAISALILSNSPLAPLYFNLRDLELHFVAGGWSGHASLQHIINDGLMAVFFFVVGLEIKRELLVGELNSGRKAALPIAGAIGGMIVPAAIYASLNYPYKTISGWAVPMTTDIAFALGVLALLGWRVPLSARIFLTSMAIIDDLGAVVVIALFYSKQIVLQNLIGAGGLCVLLAICNRLGIQSALVYGSIGILVWLCIVTSGVHAAIAGVLVAATIPVVSRIDPEKFQQISQIKLQQFANATESTSTPLLDNDQEKAVHELRSTLDQIQPPMYRLQHLLHPWCTFFIMPAFAFFNAGITFNQSTAEISPLSLGIFFGLVVGKPAGIVAACWIAIHRSWAIKPTLPKKQFLGVCFLAGIGFTMALFIAGLAFDQQEFRDSSTIAIMLASLVSASIGAFLSYTGRPKDTSPAD